MDLKERFKKKFGQAAQIESEDTLKERKEQTAQQWMPIVDLSGPIVVRKDKILLGLIRIQPENLSLLSDHEKRRKVEALAEQLRGELREFQIFCIGRPVDLNQYLDWLQDKAKKEQDYTRKTIMRAYVREASQVAASGEITERRFYIIITQAPGVKAEVELKQRLDDWIVRLSDADLKAEICGEDELVDVFSLFAHPVQASFERAEMLLDLPPVLNFGGVK